MKPLDDFETLITHLTATFIKLVFDKAIIQLIKENKQTAIDSSHLLKKIKTDDTGIQKHV